MAKTEETETAVVPAVPRPDDDMLRDMNSISAALDALRGMGVEAVDIADEIGTGFTLADEAVKAQLVGKPMLLVAWSFSPGDYGQFVSVLAITEDGGKFIINDGGTGIHEQLDAYTAQNGRQNGLLLRHGLRVSRYHINPDTGAVVPRNEVSPSDVPATTYYLDTSK